MFAEECRKLAAEFPDVAYQEMMVDTFAMRLAMQPQRFDVVVTTNMFGDILSDEAAGLVGGLGLAPGLCVGHRWGMAQATHGSAPDIAGRGIANPYAMIVSGQMLLAWLARHKDLVAARAAAERIGAAIDDVLKQPALLTPDLGGNGTTTSVADLVLARIAA
jgi:3-isopropylmalate dehydrogenase